MKAMSYKQLLQPADIHKNNMKDVERILGARSYLRSHIRADFFKIIF